MTKKETALLNAYNRATATTLSDVYAKYSVYKGRAYNACIQEMCEFDGYDHRIPSYNQQVFSFAYRYMKDGAERLRYHTAYNVYDFEIGKGV